MKLGDIVDQVCSMVRQNDTESKARCAGFAKRRYEMIWKRDLWKDSLQPITCTLPVAAYVNATISLRADLENDWQATAQGIYQFQPGVERVIALRLADQAMSPVEMTSLFANDPSAFARTGTPVSYSILAGGLWTNAATLSCYLWASDTADLNKAITVDYIDGDGRPTSAVVVLTTTYPTLGAHLEQVPKLITAIRKDTTVDNVTIGPVGTTFVLTAYPEDTSLSPRIRIQILPKPQVNTTFYALVKNKPRALDSNDKEPELRGVEDSLVAFTAADMLFRARQHSKAREFQSEGLALLKELQNQCTWQEASFCQLTPVGEPGYDSEFGGRW